MENSVQCVDCEDRNTGSALRMQKNWVLVSPQPRSIYQSRRCLNYVHAHTAGRALHRAHGGFHIEAVQIGHLDLGDFFDLFLR